MSLFPATELLSLNLYFGSGSPPSYQLGLSSAQPTGDGAGLFEITGSGYARLSILNNATNFPTATTLGGVTTKKNGVDFSFAAATGTWTNITHWFFYDPTNVRPVAWGTLVPTRLLTSGDILRILAGQLVITMD